MGQIHLVGLVKIVADQSVDLESVPQRGTILTADAPSSRVFTWWFPEGFTHVILPIAGGVHCAWPEAPLVETLKRRSPWELKELPVLGLQYGERCLAVIVPWPHYVDVVVEDRIGIRFAFPRERNNTTPCELVIKWTDAQPLSIAKEFRKWRKGASNIGAIPRPRNLETKAKVHPMVERLYGAPHFYLWGPAGFSRHDVTHRQWISFAKGILHAKPGTAVHQLVTRFSKAERNALLELAKAEWPANYLTVAIAGAIDRSLQGPVLTGNPEADPILAYQRNRQALFDALGSGLASPTRWGDGLSIPLLEAIKDAGLDRALLVLSDLYGEAVRPEVVQRADELGFLIGPYDSYHSVHAPDALPDDTWETAQFDRTAFEIGRVVKEQGRKQGGFKGRGFHFSPQAAWPYVKERVSSIHQRNHYTGWFIDCDATGECFDDYHPQHPANRVKDVHFRRDRLKWLEQDRGMLVGSEGGSVLFADVIHFGHGPHTPYIGHLHPGFRDRNSPHFLGRHWPPDSPEQSFKPVSLPDALKSPYFDPTVRIPLYQAALGDELLATHHWSFDSMKLSNVAGIRALLEILYAVSPMYHMNREMWPKRKDAILHHVSFWGPLHRAVAELEMTHFEWLSEDRLIQRTTFGSGAKEIKVTVNFGENKWHQIHPLSAQVSGINELAGKIYRVRTGR